MRRPFVPWSAAALVLLLGSAFAADGFKSGPQAPAIKVNSFTTLHCSGPDAGEKSCLV